MGQATMCFSPFPSALQMDFRRRVVGLPSCCSHKVLTAACIAWNNHGLATRRVKAARAIQLKPKEGLSLGRRARLCCGCSVRGRQEGCCQSGPASSRIMLSVLSRMKDTINVCRPERPNSHATSGIERERTLQQPSWMTFARLSVNLAEDGCFTMRQLQVGARAR